MKVLFLAPLLIGLSGSAQASPDGADLSPYGTPCRYPDSALAAKVEGAVGLSYNGTDEGRLVDVRILQHSGNAELDDAALQCVAKWQFDPKSPMAKFYRGQKRLSINWRIPAPIPGKVQEKPAGYEGGIPHLCLMDYPAQAVRDHIGGIVRVAFLIKADGSVEDVRVDNSSGSDLLDRAALGCVRHWRYRPAVDNGNPKDVPWKAEVVWRIRDPEQIFAPVMACTSAYAIKPEQIARGDGLTDLSFVIIGDKATAIKVIHSSGSDELDEVAKTCVMNTSFAVMMLREGEKESKAIRINWKLVLSKAK